MSDSLGDADVDGWVVGGGGPELVGWPALVVDGATVLTMGPLVEEDAVDVGVVVGLVVVMVLDEPRAAVVGPPMLMIVDDELPPADATPMMMAVTKPSAPVMMAALTPSDLELYQLHAPIAPAPLLGCS